TDPSCRCPSCRRTRHEWSDPACHRAKDHCDRHRWRDRHSGPGRKHLVIRRQAWGMKPWKMTLELEVISTRHEKPAPCATSARMGRGRVAVLRGHERLRGCERFSDGAHVRAITILYPTHD